MLIITQCKTPKEASDKGHQRLKEGYKFCHASTYHKVFSFTIAKGLREKVIYNAPDPA